MLDGGKIVSQALLRLGNVADYNDDRSRKYIAGQTQLEQVVRKLSNDNSLNFNVTTVNLTTNDFIDNEYRFNKPVDFLGIAKVIQKRRAITGSVIMRATSEVEYRDTTNVRLQGEYIFSDKPTLKLNYIRYVPLTEMPEYLEELVIWNLCRDLALSWGEFGGRIEYSEMKAKEELYRVQCKEGLGVVYDN